MSKVISVCNQKGGVGKTTSATNLAAQLSLFGDRVLLIDLDPQANASSGLGIPLREKGEDLYDLFLGEISLEALVSETEINNLKVIPASEDLISLEFELGKRPGRELILRSALKLAREPFDYVILDCPPSSGLLTLNALGASDNLIIPLQAEYYALEGISSLLKTLEFVRTTFNPGLDLLGVFITLYDARTNLSQQVLEEARNHFGAIMFDSVIPRSIKLAECPSHQLPICLYDPFSAGAKAYSELAKELKTRCESKVEEKVGNL